MTKISIGALLLMCASFQSHAGIIIASADSNIGSGSNSVFFKNVFANQNVIGYNSATQSWALDNWDTIAVANASSYSQSTSLLSLSGADWVIAASAISYSNSDLATIEDFFTNGGNVWVGGEASAYGAHNAGNQLLGYLSSSMSFDQIGTTSYSLATNTGLDVYTTGTTTFSNNYSSRVSGGTSLYSYQGNSVLSIERMTNSVPEPTSLALLGFGLVALRMSRKKTVG